MLPPNEIDNLLSDLFLNLEVSELDRQRCSHFIGRAGWSGLVTLETADLIRGHLSISRVPALKLAAAIALCKCDHSASRRQWTLEDICDDLRSLQNEELRGIYWDDQGNIIHAQTLAIGTVDTVEISPYFALRPAFMFGSRRMTLAHNHPSHNGEMSTSDIAVFKRLCSLAALLGITIDSMVVVV